MANFYGSPCLHFNILNILFNVYSELIFLEMYI